MRRGEVATVEGDLRQHGGGSGRLERRARGRRQLRRRRWRDPTATSRIRAIWRGGGEREATCGTTVWQRSEDLAFGGLALGGEASM